MLNRLKAYYIVTKPGIVRGNAVHVLAGALLAVAGPINWPAIFGVLVGTSLVIASACVANNYMDRGIDARMQRTKSRPSVTGQIRPSFAMVYLTLLLVLGFLTLLFFTNAAVLVIGGVAYIMYVFVYGWAKRSTTYSTLIGAVPGALPAMAGYVAVSGQVTIGAWLVFLLVFVWQMPHFYAISLFRKEEYRAAGLPVLGVVKPFETVRRRIMAYMVAYLLVIAVLLATFTIEPAAGLLLTAGAAFWAYVVLKRPTNQLKWARSVFGTSLLVALILMVASVLHAFLRTWLYTIK